MKLLNYVNFLILCGILSSGCISVNYVSSEYQTKEGKPRLVNSSGITMDIIRFRVEDDGWLDIKLKVSNNSSQLYTILKKDISIENPDSGKIFEPFVCKDRFKNQLLVIAGGATEREACLLVKLGAKSKEEFPKRLKLTWEQNSLIFHVTEAKVRVQNAMDREM